MTIDWTKVECEEIEQRPHSQAAYRQTLGYVKCFDKPTIGEDGPDFMMIDREPDA